MSNKKQFVTLVEIDPIKYDFRLSENFRNPRIIRYWDVKFSPVLNQENVNSIIEKEIWKKKPTCQNNPDQYLIWQYPNEPQLYFDRLNQAIFVSEGTLKEFGKRNCQHQASCFLEILKKHRFVKFRRKSVTVNPTRLGNTKEDRKETYEACEILIEGYLNCLKNKRK